MSDYSYIYYKSDNENKFIRHVNTNIYSSNFGGNSKKKVYINRFTSPLNPEHINDINEDMTNFIFNTINNIEENKYEYIFVLTHHCPSFELLKMKQLNSDCYANNFDDKIKKLILI